MAIKEVIPTHTTNKIQTTKGTLSSSPLQAIIEYLLISIILKALCQNEKDEKYTLKKKCLKEFTIQQGKRRHEYIK